MATARPARLEAARERLVADAIAPGLTVLFCGINPGLHSAAAGHHFAGPGNRFWKALHAGGFTPRLLAPAEERELLEHGVGITNLVARATARASEVSAAELQRGRAALEAKAARYAPAVIAFLGVGAYRAAFGRPRAAIGRLAERVGPAEAWLLPNPSGLNAHYQLPELGRRFAEVRAAAGAAETGR